MKLSEITIKNFRLLQDARMRRDTVGITAILVGSEQLRQDISHRGALGIPAVAAAPALAQRFLARLPQRIREFRAARIDTGRLDIPAPLGSFAVIDLGGDSSAKKARVEALFGAQRCFEV